MMSFSLILQQQQTQKEENMFQLEYRLDKSVKEKRKLVDS